MRTRTIGLFAVVMIGVCGATFAQDPAARGGRAGGGGQGGGQGAGDGGGLVSMPVLMPEPADQAVIFSTADLQKKYGEMEAAKAGAWRIVDGGTRTVNIRIGTIIAKVTRPVTLCGDGGLFSLKDV